MGWFMPLVLGGIAFVGVPWLIHRIRKPTRKPTPFSSLMFVPQAVPPVRERKKIEHPWLMLVRMVILALLALAFSRPFTLAPAAADPQEQSAQEHVILVDTSLSTSPRFDELRTLATSCLADFGRQARVAVVAFNDTPRVMAALHSNEDSDVGTLGRARQAIGALMPSEGGTRYIPALQQAEQMLRPAGEVAVDEGEDVERVIHLVSDLQRSGLPADVVRYTLARGIALRVVPLPGVAPENRAVTAVAVAPRLPSSLDVRARLRNFSDQRVDGSVQLWLDGQLVKEDTVSLQADSNTTFSLSTEVDLDRGTRGEVRLVPPDLLVQDNVRYFVYEPEPVREIGLVVDGGADGVLPFLEAAVADSQPLPWRLVPLEVSALTDTRPDRALPPVIVVPGLGTLTDAQADALAAYVSGGGGLLLVPATTGFPVPLVVRLLAPAGVVAGDALKDTIDPGSFALLNWIDFGSPVFASFRSAAYSDFSMVRFQNYIRMNVMKGSMAGVVARLESAGNGDGDSAVVQFAAGDGHVLVWAFPLDPAWTNITRTRRFIPMLHESIALLLPSLSPPRALTVGGRVSAPLSLSDATEQLRLDLPGVATRATYSELRNEPHSAVLARAGFIHWFAGGEEAPSLVEPVNTDADESELGIFSEDEFLLRIGAVSRDVATAAAIVPPGDNNVVHFEYGYYVLVLLVLAGILESGMAVYYGRHPSREHQPS